MMPAHYSTNLVIDLRVFWHQQDNPLPSPRYRRGVRTYLDNTSPDRRIGGRASVEYPHPTHTIATLHLSGTACVSYISRSTNETLLCSSGLWRRVHSLADARVPATAQSKNVGILTAVVTCTWFAGLNHDGPWQHAQHQCRTSCRVSGGNTVKVPSKGTGPRDGFACVT